MSKKPYYENVSDWLAGKKNGHYVVERWGRRWAISIHHPVEGLETVFADTPAEVHRLRQLLTDEGMCGYIVEGA